MARVNDHYLELKSSYLFSDIANRVAAFGEANPSARLIRLGIGDVTRPLPPAVVKALHEAADEMARIDSFKGYGPETGYTFLTELIAAHDYGSRGVTVNRFIAWARGIVREAARLSCRTSIPAPDTKKETLMAQKRFPKLLGLALAATLATTSPVALLGDRASQRRCPRALSWR